MVVFEDRVEAGRQLGARLRGLRGQDVVVLGLPRGGVPVACEVAAVLGAPLDVIVVRKLGVPYQPELAMGAIGEDGARVLDRDLVERAGVREDEVRAVEAREREELARRVHLLREGRPRVPLSGRVAVVVDDGIATGATARVACAVAHHLGAARVVLAVPVAPSATPPTLREADEVVCLATPEPFYAVGAHYRDFDPVSDAEVTRLLAETQPAAPPGPRVARDVREVDAGVEIPVGEVRLAGHLRVPTGATGVVLFAHGSGSSRLSPRNRYVADALGRAGLGTLLFDLLTDEESLDRGNVFDIDLLAGRLAAATRWLVARADTAGLAIGYFGASTGAAAALSAASSEDAPVAAVVSRGGRPDLAGPRLEAVRAPTLLIVGGADAQVLDLNRAAQARLRCGNHLEVVPGATHLFEEPGTLTAVAELAADWFTRHLGSSLAGAAGGLGDEHGHESARAPDRPERDRGEAMNDAWQQARTQLDGLPGGLGLNIAHEAVDRHVLRGDGERVALRLVAQDESVTEVSYRTLAEQASRFAHLLDRLGVGPGETVCSLLGRGQEVFVTALGTLKHRSVFCPLFAAFGPEPVRERLRLGEARVLVTTAELYRRRIVPIRADLPELAHVLLVDASGVPGTESYADLLAAQPGHYVVGPTAPGTVALLHFTSGTTGRPKGALHVHEAVVAHHATGGYALGLREGDVFWCTADPGWVTGTSYGIIAPLTHGVTLVCDAGEYDARRWYRILERERVTVWYTAPTALRMLMRAGGELPRRYDLSSLRHVASVGEPLNPEAVVWGQDAFGVPVLDNWWQTETGAIMICNRPGRPDRPVRPGSMGLPVPGVVATVLERGPDGRAAVVDGAVREVGRPDVTGELALRPGWPSMFRGYLHDEERYHACFAGGWYLTGDLARVDVDGWFWFVGRADDVIKSAGHLIGPFEVESALMEHPAVAEAGVIGKPDPVAGEVVKAFVTLRDGFAPSEELRMELVAFGRRRLGSVAPREVSFDQHLPHTRSGKVMRRLLKARELGLPEGDLSTLERV